MLWVVGMAVWTVFCFWVGAAMAKGDLAWWRKP